MLVMASKLYDYTPAELQKLLDESNSYADVLRKINLNPKGGNPQTLKKIIAEYNLDVSKLNENRHNLYIACAEHTAKSRKIYVLEDILNGKYPNYQSGKLLKRLVANGYKEKKCERCGIVTWMGKEITFQLHHKDGNHENNHLENLEILCPNCHSQTGNFAGKATKNKQLKSKQSKQSKCQTIQYGISEDGQRFYDGYGYYKILCPICKEHFMNKSAKMCNQCRNKERNIPQVSKEELLKIMKTNSYSSAADLLGVDRKTVSRWHKYYTHQEREDGNMMIGSDKAPTREVLKEKIRTMPFLQIGKEYNVSDNAVRRWCDAYELPRKSSDIKLIPDEEWVKI